MWTVNISAGSLHRAMLSPLSGVALSITLNDITNTEDNKKHVKTIIDFSDQIENVCAVLKSLKSC